MGGNQVENNATLWPNLQNCKISSRVEIPKLDPSVAIFSTNIFGGSQFDQIGSINYRIAPLVLLPLELKHVF